MSRVALLDPHCLATVAPPAGAEPRLFFVSEHTEIHSSVEAEQRDLAGREVELAEQIMTRLAWHFGIEACDKKGPRP